MKKKEYQIFTKNKFKAEAEMRDYLSNSDYIALMNMYLSEWDSRNNNLWHQLYRYFFAVLVVTMLPHLGFLELGTLKYFQLIFPITGFVMTICFFVVMKGYAMRMGNVSKIYGEMIERLPKELRRERIVDPVYGRLMTNFVVIVMTVSLFMVVILSFAIILLKVDISASPSV